MTSYPEVKVGDMLEVKVTRVTIGRDKKMYVTIEHPHFQNAPSLTYEPREESIFRRREELSQ